MKKLITIAIVAVATTMATATMARTAQQEEGLKRLEQLQSAPCHQLASIIKEAAELRDQGKGQQVAYHTAQFRANYPTNPDFQTFTGLMINELYRKPDISAERAYDRTYEICING